MKAYEIDINFKNDYFKVFVNDNQKPQHTFF